MKRILLIQVAGLVWMSLVFGCAEVASTASYDAVPSAAVDAAVKPVADAAPIPTADAGPAQSLGGPTIDHSRTPKTFMKAPEGRKYFAGAAAALINQGLLLVTETGAEGTPSKLLVVRVAPGGRLVGSPQTLGISGGWQGLDAEGGLALACAENEGKTTCFWIAESEIVPGPVFEGTQSAVVAHRAMDGQQSFLVAYKNVGEYKVHTISAKPLSQGITTGLPIGDDPANSSDRRNARIRLAASTGAGIFILYGNSSVLRRVTTTGATFSIALTIEPGFYGVHALAISGSRLVVTTPWPYNAYFHELAFADGMLKSRKSTVLFDKFNSEPGKAGWGFRPRADGDRFLISSWAGGVPVEIELQTFLDNPQPFGGPGNFSIVKLPGKPALYFDHSNGDIAVWTEQIVSSL